MKSVYEQVSAKLRKKLEKARPEEGRRGIFKLSARSIPNKRGVPESYQIMDYTHASSDRMEAKTIMYITGSTPAGEDGKSSPILEKLAFTKPNNGLIVCSGKADQNKFDYLYLSPYMEGNDRKEWFHPANMHPFYKHVEPEASAERTAERRRDLAKAHAMLEDMGSKALRKAVRGFAIKGVNESSTDDQIRNAIYEQVVEKDPRRLFNMDKDREFDMKVLIDEAMEKNIIVYRENYWTMAASDNSFYKVLPGEDPEKVLAMHLESSNGKANKETIIAQIRNGS